MTKSSDLNRLQRLEELKGLLKTFEYSTAADLAAELGVSLRTLNRDLDLLRNSGLPIESDRGRGGGIRLHRSWSMGRLQLHPGEAIDLLLSITIAEQINSPLLLGHLNSLKRKISAAFTDIHQKKIRNLRKRILIGSPASTAVLNSIYQPVSTQSEITEAFFNLQCLEIEYIDNHQTVTTRIVEPQFLYFSMPVWYLLTWDYLRNAIRFFRMDRIKRARIVESNFRMADPRPYLAIAEEGIKFL
jgi:predicted DNA-binding transcriptional regulator YafY